MKVSEIVEQFHAMTNSKILNKNSLVFSSSQNTKVPRADQLRK